MGNCIAFSIPLDQSVNKVSQWMDEKVTCIHNLDKNLMALEATMVDLKAKQNDLLRWVKREEDRGLQRLDKFQVWLTRVLTLENKVNDLLSAKNVQLQRLCLCGFCSKRLKSSYCYGKCVLLALREVEKLKSEDFEVIVEQALTPMVEERQLQATIVGQETMLEKAWKHLMKDEVGVMEFNVEKIQDEIAEKVGLCGDKSEKGIHLFNFLHKKRFVLFLDDIWEKVDLADVGVPDPRTQNGCKVVFTTRSQSVCSRMGVENPMEVQSLGDNDALFLFQKKVGQITLGSDPKIPQLARKVAKKCCGLPLALNIIGETMSCKKTIQEWEHALHVLNSYSAKFSDMKEKIFPLLKYSYDSLKGEHVKSCFLYCALFPEDHEIDIEDLIDYWIREGIIDENEGIEKAENEGYDIIGSLVRSSLLMYVNGRDYVCMHDVVREMALWISSDLGKQKEAFIVRAGVGLKDIPKVNNWTVVKRMSLIDNKINHLAGSNECLELTTLLLQRGSLTNISSEFFMSMPKLAVLDLSANPLLSQLSEGISELVCLQYLNLASTGIYQLPKGLQKLMKLLHLDLENTRVLNSIDGISSVQSLKVLKLKGSLFTWDLDTLKELETLEHLEILTTTIENCTPCLLQSYLSSYKLISCTKSLDIRNMESSGISHPAFNIHDNSVSEIRMRRKCSFLSLVNVSVYHVTGLRELTVLMFAPNLRILNVSRSHQIEDIINKEKACKVENSGILPFLRLKELILRDLPLLKNIYWSPLPFQCLEIFIMQKCPNLKKLPLD